MSKYCTHIILICLVFFSVPSFAQTVKSKLYMLENDEADKPKILTLYQNSDGLILCGTTKGLYRFDGFDFSPYPSALKINAAVTSIFETRDKKIFIGFSNGNIGTLQNNSIG